MTGLPLASIIIANYNYERYVGAAIESALAIDWPNKQIIVVDDGSQDGSWNIIQSYADRGVLCARQPNSGQAVATDRGYAMSSGQLVLFLDADDLAEPTILRRVWGVFYPGVSKVQVEMETIDADGASLGARYPKYLATLTPADVRRSADELGTYTTPPNSGNVYARDYLDKIFPLEPGMDRAPDSYCLTAAPFLGDVITIPSPPLIFYRVHGRNIAAQSAFDPARFAFDLNRAIKRRAYSVKKAAEYGVTVTGNMLRNSLPTLLLRICSLRFLPEEHPVPKDTRGKILADLARALRLPQGQPKSSTVLMAALIAIVALLPSRISATLISWRYVPLSRPRFIRWIIARV